MIRVCRACMSSRVYMLQTTRAGRGVAVRERIIGACPPLRIERVLLDFTIFFFDGPVTSSGGIALVVMDSSSIV